jgi:hypothetical protein
MRSGADIQRVGKESTMRSKAILGSLLALTVLFVGCSTMTVPGAEVTDNGNLLFSAEASAPVMKADDAMAMLEAQTAAATMAKANLLEKIKGAFVAGKVEVKDLTFAAQGAATRVDGVLSRVNVTIMPMERTGQMAMVVTAVASLELTCEQFMDLGAYVQ